MQEKLGRPSATVKRKSSRKRGRPPKNSGIGKERPPEQGVPVDLHVLEQNILLQKIFHELQQINHKLGAVMSHEAIFHVRDY